MSRLLALSATLGLLLCSVAPAHAAGFEKELTNALARGEKGKADTLLVLHPSGGDAVEITPADFESYEIHMDGHIPVAIEMYAGKGKKKNDIWINLMRATYWRMDIEKIDGKWNYEFHFYF